MYNFNVQYTDCVQLSSLFARSGWTRRKIVSHVADKNFPRSFLPLYLMLLYPCRYILAIKFDI